MLIPDDVKAFVAHVNAHFASEFALELSEMEDRAGMRGEVRDLTTMSSATRFTLPNPDGIASGVLRLLKFKTVHAIEALRRARGAPSPT